MQRVYAQLNTWREKVWPPNNEISEDMIKDFNSKKDILVIPERLDLKTLNRQVRDLVTTWDKLGRVIRVKYTYTPAIVKSH